MSGLAQRPHRRLNPLTGEWVLVSPHRTQRPWQGQTETPAPAPQQPYDPRCYLCPGNERAGGARNPAYGSTFVFDNDYAALLPASGASAAADDGGGLLVAQPESGVCRVVCFSPRHDLTLARMSEAEARAVVDVWQSQYRELGERPDIGYVQIFENRGAMMGASNPHPHGQIWASASVPTEPLKEQGSLLAHRARAGGCLLCAYAELESARKERVVYEDDAVVVVVPYWAVWPFETLVLPRAHLTGLDAFDDSAKDAFARALRRLTAGYDRVFSAPFPYSMGLHQRPTDGQAHEEWHLHAHFFPPLLRSATVRKFMVGYEMLCSPQRDITPEAAAERLRAALNA